MYVHKLFIHSKLFYPPLIPTNVPFSECCDSIQVFYGSPNQEHTYVNFYGYYVKQEVLINERAWYKNGDRSIWWDGINDWWIGKTASKGDGRGFAYLTNNGSCLPNIADPKWIFWDGSSWIDAGSEDVKIQCRSSGTALCHTGREI